MLARYAARFSARSADACLTSHPIRIVAPVASVAYNATLSSAAGVRWFSDRSFSEVAAADSDSASTTTAGTNASLTLCRRSRIRNVAVIAHVDHGKTTLVDQLLKAAKADSCKIGERLMDCGDLEKERGITITSKVTRVEYNGIINIADTPGHSDFSGEVDRFLSLSDGFILVVDAAEGPKSQTKYVLSRALALGLKPIVVLNKCDRPDAIARIDSGETEHKLMALFETLRATPEQKEFLTLYASAREGWVTDDPLSSLELTETGLTNPDEHGMKRLLDYVVEQIPEPSCQYYGDADAVGHVDEGKDFSFFADDKFSMAAVTVGNDQYLGRTCTGRIMSGSIGMSDSVAVMKRRPEGQASEDSDNNLSNTTQIAGVFVFEGIERKPYENRAYAGDIVTLAGVPNSIAVGDTLTGSANPVGQPINTPPLAPPTLSMDFGANDGPLAGREGTKVASSKIRERLLFETDNNVTLKVEVAPHDPEKTVVYARGELQLGILIETMRREGFEIVISPPRILTKTCPETGKTLEPYEEVTVDVDTEFSSAVISALTGDRRGIVVEMTEGADGKSHIVLEVPSRGLLGFNNEIATATRGSAVVNHLFLEDRPYQALGTGLVKGKLVSNSTGKATTYALNTISQRGTLFIAPGDTIYEGMVIGENAKPGDLEVNAVKAKEKTNMRTKAQDETVYLPPPRRLSVEELIGYMEPDEVIEITPKSIRLRKKLLDAGERERASRQKAKQLRASK